MLGLQVEVGRVVLELRDHGLAVELVVSIVTIAKEPAERREEAVHAVGAAAKRDVLAPRRQLGFSLFHDRNAVLGVVVAVASAEVAVFTRPAHADGREAAARLAVVDLAFGRIEVAGPLSTARGMQRELVVAPGHVRTAHGFRRGGPEVERRTAVRAIHALRRNRLADDIHEPANRVRSVQQRRRPAHNLDARRTRWIDRNAVIARLAGQVTDALAVLQDQHAIAIETANHRPRGPGPHRSLGHTRLRAQRGADRRPQLLEQILSRDTAVG